MGESIRFWVWYGDLCSLLKVLVSSSLNLWRSCSCCHSLCVFVCMLMLSIHFGFYNVSTSRFCWCFLSILAFTVFLHPLPWGSLKTESWGLKQLLHKLSCIWCNSDISLEFCKYGAGSYVSRIFTNNDNYFYLIKATYWQM